MNKCSILWIKCRREELPPSYLQELFSLSNSSRKWASNVENSHVKAHLFGLIEDSSRSLNWLIINERTFKAQTDVETMWRIRRKKKVSLIPFWKIWISIYIWDEVTKLHSLRANDHQAEFFASVENFLNQFRSRTEFPVECDFAGVLTALQSDQQTGKGVNTNERLYYNSVRR